MWGRALKSEKILAISIFIMIVTVAVWAAFRPDLIPHFNLVLLAGLIAVTTIYAYSTIQISRATKDQADKMKEQAEATRRQADASVKMAEEMANTRYDAFRPIIDIVEMPMEPTEKVKKAFDAGDGKFPEELPCVLRNIGIGPAIGVSSFIIVPSNSGQRPWDLGTIPAKEETAEIRLSLQQAGSRMVLAAYYKDVYGRDIESKREVTLDKERHSWKIHPLETQVRKITEGGAQQ
jgi:hypothetical protein